MNYQDQKIIRELYGRLDWQRFRLDWQRFQIAYTLRWRRRPSGQIVYFR